jgi:carboxyl-terminal processing protease
MVKLSILFFLVTSCNAERRPPSPAVQKYLEEVVRIMQASSINRAAINWVAFKKNLLAQASGANTIEQAYPAVEFAIVALGDKHTQFYGAHPLKGPKIPPAKQLPLSRFPETSATSGFPGLSVVRKSWTSI